MNSEERAAAVFGAYDGVVSIIGFVFGLLLHRSPQSAIAIGALGGAVSATISMSSGTFESAEGTLRSRIGRAVAMGLATLIGSAVPVWPFFVFGRTGAVVAGAIGCLVVAGWIGYEKRRGVQGYVFAYVILLAATGLTLGIVALIPASA